MIYTCDKCRFIFSRVGDVDTCPDCGKPFVREATKIEQDEYHKHQSEKKK